MCGISAIWAPGQAMRGRTLRAMNELMAHRGPDAEGLVALGSGGKNPMPHHAKGSLADGPWDDEKADLWLAHRRLAIVDLSEHGSQPMTAPQSRSWLVFNGEIYNYLELRQELAAHWQFQTQTDTEVLLAAWAQWGPQCLPRLRGMFAFALWDDRDKTLWAVRDRFGIKPLYIWRLPNGGIALASEIKQFTALPCWQARLNGQRAYDFLQWNLSDHTAETLFAGVRQVPPGNLCRFELNNDKVTCQEHPWYGLPRADAHITDLHFAKRLPQLQALLESSVNEHLQADVPVGSCLSGGLDSSLIVGWVARLRQDSGAARHTITAASPLANEDESHFAAQVATFTQSQGHEILLDWDAIWSAWEDVIWHQDEPHASLSIHAQHLVFKKAREAGLTVMLDGQGADELFGGYHQCLAPLLQACQRQQGWLAMAQSLLAVSRRNHLSFGFLLPFLLDQYLPDFLRYPIRRMLDKPQPLPNWLDLKHLRAEPSNPMAELRLGETPERHFRHHWLMRYSLPRLLHYEDRNSMAFSIEARVPYLDHRIVEEALCWREDALLHEGWTKAPLRWASKDIIPPSITWRTDKKQFGAPEAHWFHSNAEAFEKELSNVRETLEPLLRPAFYRCWAEAQKRGTYHDRFSRVLALGKWMRRFGVKLT